MKKKLMVYLAACLLLIVSACGSRQLDALNPLETAVEVADLAEVAEVAALVPLEEGEGSILTYPSKMLLLPDGTMVVKDSGGKVLAFSPEGRFVCRVGAKGRGPGEFTSVQDICYDDRNRTVCILDRGKILRYHAADGSFASTMTKTKSYTSPVKTASVPLSPPAVPRSMSCWYSPKWLSAVSALSQNCKTQR